MLSSSKAYGPGVVPTSLVLRDIDSDALSRVWTRMYIKSSDLSVEDVKCAKLSYTLATNSKDTYRFDISRILKDDKLSEVTGTFSRTSSSPLAQYTLTLGGLNVTIPLWLVMVGPIYYDEYQYAVLVSPDLSTIFIDARDEKLFNEHYKCAVWAFLKNKLNVDTNSLIDISRDDACLNKIELEDLESTMAY